MTIEQQRADFEAWGKIDFSESVEKDRLGYWTNAGVPDFNEDENAFNLWVEQQGLEIHKTSLENENEDNPIFQSYFENGNADISGWRPQPPADDWHILSIHDTEYGPVFVWARRIKKEAV